MRNAARKCAVLTAGLTLALAAAVGCENRSEAEPAAPATQPSTQPSTRPAAAAVAPGEFQSHEVTAGDFRFKAPAAWKKAEKAGSMAVMTLYVDEHKSSLRVNAMDLGPGEGLRQTVAASEAQVPRANKNFKHARTEFFQAKGAAAARVMFDVAARGQNLKVMQVLIARGRKMYGLTFTAAADKFAALSPTFEQVIASAEFE